MHKTKVCLSITLAILIVAGSFIYSLTVIEALAQAKGKVLAGEPSPSAKKLPRLVDVGADKCVPCVMMAPILEELKKEYAGIVEIEFMEESGSRTSIQDQGNTHPDLLRYIGKGGP
jgi:thiol-disulfide isomerase/thioredoxin